MSFAVEQAKEYCRALIAKADPDRYLSSLLAPADKRAALWALYAFNMEIAATRENVTEPGLGEIRLEWWAQSLGDIYDGRVVDHPVLAALGPIVRDAEVPQAALLNMIEARRFDFYDDPMPGLNDLEGYLGETSSMLMQVAARILSGAAADRLADVSGYAGVAVGLTGLLRALPVHSARGQCYLPGDVLQRHGLTSAHVLSRRKDEAMDAVLADLRDIAAKRLAQARALRDAVPDAALAAFLPAGLVDLYLKALQRVGGNPMLDVVEVSQFKRQARLWWLQLRQQF
jgi:phytoene synthase